MCWMTPAASAAGAATWAAGLAAALAAALFGCAGLLVQLLGAIGGARPQLRASRGRPAQRAAQVRREVARNNASKAQCPHPGLANSSDGVRVRTPRFQKRFSRTRSFQVVRSISPKHQRQPKPKSNVLGPLTERAPQNSFASIVQKMAPVEERNGKKVDQPDAYRKDSHQIEQRQKAEIGHLAGHFGDADGPGNWSAPPWPPIIWAIAQRPWS